MNMMEWNGNLNPLIEIILSIIMLLVACYFGLTIASLIKSIIRNISKRMLDKKDFNNCSKYGKAINDVFKKLKKR